MLAFKVVNLITMDIQSEKIELAKRLLDTENESIINAVKSVLDSFDNTNEWADLPEKVIKDIEESLSQIEAGKEISHLKARETYKKWL
ncbi:hypothetical protein [Dyadobacter luticola]|uniref:Uncharacterized protein n=1 Tax=Dyadobacter luticola TaxID=1979387 RepID=A0A5R9KPZ3_9BACT|nr:hypothetical protein [Dyadobacter luticola]TLU98188.1 hypothetical protein FEN17_25775 [Dyadobacter luticola]